MRRRPVWILQQHFRRELAHRVVVREEYPAGEPVQEFGLPQPVHDRPFHFRQVQRHAGAKHELEASTRPLGKRSTDRAAPLFIREANLGGVENGRRQCQLLEAVRVAESCYEEVA